MKTRVISLVLISLLCISFLPGCVFVSADFRQTRNIILDEIGPADVDTEVQLRVGPGLMSFTSLLVGFADVEEEAVTYLQDIKNVQVGVYKLDMDHRRRITIPEKISSKMARKGYTPMVKTKSSDEAVWVLTKMKGKRLDALYVIAVDRSELVLVEVRGRLERLIEKALEEHGFSHGDFDFMDM